MSHEPAARCDDPNTWNHKDEVIDLPTLLALIEAHGGSQDLDLHGCKIQNLDLSYQALLPWLAARPDRPPWVYGVWGIKLEGVHFEHAQIMTSNLAGADLLSARLDGTHFLSVNLDKASLVAATMRSGSLMWCSAKELTAQNSTMEGSSLIHTDLSNALFGGANLQRVRLWDSELANVDLRLVDLTGSMLHGTRFDRNRMVLGNIGHRIGDELAAVGRLAVYFPVTFAMAGDVYRDLKINFQTTGEYGGAAWAYIKEKQMEKASHFPTTVGHRWLRFRVRRLIRKRRKNRPLTYRRLGSRLLYQAYSALLHLRLFLGWCPPPLRTAMQASFNGGGSRVEWLSRRRWLRNWAYELSTGYGERPINTVGLGVITILAFAAAFFVTRAIDNLWDAISYSFATFATFNLVDPGVQPHGRWMNLASSLESVLGITLLALFVFTLGNRMSRS